MKKLGFLTSDDIVKEKVANSLIVPANYTHSCAIGATGCGKTTSYIYPNLNERIKNQHGILLFDYKGKESAAVQTIAKRNDRLKDVIEIGVPWGANINLIKYMNEAEIRKLTISIMGFTDKNDYWSTTGANIVVSLWKAMKSYTTIVEEATKIGLEDSFIWILNDSDYPMMLTFRSFLEVVSTKERLTKFVSKLSSVHKKFKRTLDNNLNAAFDTDSKEAVFKKFEALTMEIVNFSNIIDEDMKPLKIFDEARKSSNNSTTLQSIALSMATTFGTIGNIDAFNSDDVDLVEELNKSKIVVINTKELNSNVLSEFVNTLFNELSKRVVQPNISSISIFIDEAQRVMNKDTDVHIDVFRESKVELFLAFQNSQLMIDAIGENKFSALLQNLTDIYFFKNILEFKNYKTSNLKKFEYYSNNNSTKINRAKALFLDEKEIFKTQKEYFLLNDFYKLLNIEEYAGKGIVVFNSHLFSQGKIQIKHKNGSGEIIEIKNKILLDKAHLFMEEVLSRSTEDIFEEELFDDESLESILLGMNKSRKKRHKQDS